MKAKCPEHLRYKAVLLQREQLLQIVPKLIVNEGLDMRLQSLGDLWGEGVGGQTGTEEGHKDGGQTAKGKDEALSAAKKEKDQQNGSNNHIIDKIVHGRASFHL